MNEWILLGLLLKNLNDQWSYCEKDEISIYPCFKFLYQFRTERKRVIKKNCILTDLRGIFYIIESLKVASIECLKKKKRRIRHVKLINTVGC